MKVASGRCVSGTLSACLISTAALLLTSCAPSDEELSRRVRETLKGGEFGPAAEVIEREFPDLWTDIQSSIVRQYRAGGSPEAIQRAGFARADAFMAENSRYATQASDEALAKVFAGRSAYLQALAAEDVRLCAKFAFSNLDADDGGEEISPAARRIAAQGAAAVFAAVAEGKRLQVSRERPTESDVNETMRALQAAKTSRVSMEVITSRSPTTFPAADQCAAGVSFYKAVQKLAPAGQARFMAAALAPSSK